MKEKRQIAVQLWRENGAEHCEREPICCIWVEYAEMLSKCGRKMEIVGIYPIV